jgi:hypothetical protein
MERGLVFSVNVSAVITVAVDGDTELNQEQLRETIEGLFLARANASMDGLIDSFELIAVEPL